MLYVAPVGAISVSSTNALGLKVNISKAYLVELESDASANRTIAYTSHAIYIIRSLVDMHNAIYRSRSCEL